MKKMTTLILAMILGLNLTAQIKGDQNIITKTFPLLAIKSLEINLTANVIIDMKGPDEISITTDANLIPYISREVKKGGLDLTQKEWIQPSSDIKIRIGASALRKIISDAHSDIKIENMSVEDFKVIVNVGTVQLSGTVKNIMMKCQVGEIEASSLIVENAEIRITSWGKVTAKVLNHLTTFIDEDGQLKILNEPKELSGDAKNKIAKAKKKKETGENEIRFFDLKLKNNSWTRKQYVVVGPKPDGRSFSYGFPMNPGQIRKKHWTNGTKVYQTNRWGIRKLVRTIKLEDEGQEVNLYTKE